MKTTLTFRDGCDSETVAYLRRGGGALTYVRISNNSLGSARLHAEDCRELAAFLVEAADEMERKS